MGCCSSYEAPSFLVQIYVCPLLPSNNISWVRVGGICLLISSSQERQHPSELSPPTPSRVQQLPRPSTHPAFLSSIMWPQVLWPRILVWSCASTQKAWPQRKQLGAMTQRALGLGDRCPGTCLCSRAFVLEPHQGGKTPSNPQLSILHTAIRELVPERQWDHTVLSPRT